MGVVGRLDQYASMLAYEFDETTANGPSITGLGTYYASEFSENVGIATTMTANVFAPYDLVYDEFGGTLFGAGQGRYMRQYTDKSVIVYNEIDEIGFTPSYRIFSSATSVNEGSSVTFTANANNVETGTTLYYDITGSVGIASADFTNNSLSGSLVISGSFDLGFGSTTLTLANDLTTEGTETFNMNLRTGSISGPIVVTSSTITISDTSTISPNLVLNLDAANYSAMPVDGSTISGSGNYAIGVVNPTPRISWNSANGGVFRVTTASTNNFLTFGPNYSSGTQAFTVGMAYKWNGVTAGRLLNANTASPDFLMGLWGNGATPIMNLAFANGFTGANSNVADTAWHFIWFSSTGAAGASKAKSYVATNTAPTGTFGTSSTNDGFNGLRLFGRFSNATTSSEQVDADIGFVKVWDKELTLAEIQAEHATYKARFGY